MDIDIDLSSSEMTAYWRSLYPQISGDSLSKQLASKNGITKAKAFEERFDYPKVGRHVSARAGFFLNEAVEILLNGDFDVCISLGSGFSLLTYYIAQTIAKQKPAIAFIDVDLASILQARKVRLEGELAAELAPDILNRIAMQPLDLESAYQAGHRFQSCFPNYKKPLFVIEGMIYFLSAKCVNWIGDGIQKYKSAALLFDYWPKDGPENSACFKRVVESLQGFMPENVKSFLTPVEVQRLCHNQLVKDIGLQEAEKELAEQVSEEPQLLFKDEIILARLAVAIK